MHNAFRGPGGRLILRSTKQSDRAKALAVARELERAAKLAMRGELVENQAREILADIMKRADTGESLRTVSVTAHFRAWLASKEARKAAKTTERYTNVVNRFLEFLGPRADKSLTALAARA